MENRWVILSTATFVPIFEIGLMIIWNCGFQLGKDPSVLRTSPRRGEPFEGILMIIWKLELGNLKISKDPSVLRTSLRRGEPYEAILLIIWKLKLGDLGIGKNPSVLRTSPRRGEPIEAILLIIWGFEFFGSILIKKEPSGSENLAIKDIR